MCKGFGLFCGINTRVDDRQFAPLDIAPVEDDCARLRDGSRNHFASESRNALPCAGDDRHRVAITPNAMTMPVRPADYFRDRSAHPRSLMNLNTEVDPVLRCFKVWSARRPDMVRE